MGKVGIIIRSAVVLMQTLFYSSVIAIQILIQRIRKGAEALTPTQRPRPACLDDPRYGKHQFATLEGVTIHYVEAGDRSKPMLLLIHGFPAFWFCWHYQLTELSKHYWVVAPDMRGYGQSSKPAGKQHYARRQVASDLFELVVSLGRQSCVVAGHDWGGLIAFQLQRDRPSLVEKLIILNAPHMDAMTSLLQQSLDQLRRSWYIFVFQLPWLPEAVIALNDLAIFKMMFRHNPAMNHHYPDWLIEAFQFAFQAPNALTPPIDFYRENFQLRAVISGEKGPEPPKITCPVLVIWGEQDEALSPLLATMTARYADKFTVRFVSDASHWVMMESPEETNKLIKEFIDN